MLKNLTRQNIMNSMSIWRNRAIFFIVFFLVMTILTALLMIPNINVAFREHHQDDASENLKLEAELFTRYIKTQKTIVEDLARYPSLINAVMLARGDDTALIDFFENTTIGNQKGRLVLQDIEGNILLTTKNLFHASYKKSAAFVDQIVEGKVPFHFELLQQRAEIFTFKITVPVKYNTHVEGLLSAEIDASLNDIFLLKLYDDRVGFKLIQGAKIISTGLGKINNPQEKRSFLRSLGWNLCLFLIRLSS